MSEETQEATVELEKELEDIFGQLDALPIGKAAQLVKAMEERWGVSAAAPVAVAAAGGGGGEEEAEEKKKLFSKNCPHFFNPIPKIYYKIFHTLYL